MIGKLEGIAFKHPQYEKWIDIWQKINDICNGENLEQYLIKLNPDDESPDNVTRNTQYRQRAVFYAIAGYTARGLNGLLFSKPPTLDLPMSLEYLIEDVDGAGNSIYQQSQYVARDQIRLGRCGLTVSFPQGFANISQADVSARKAVPTIQHIKADQVTNWRTTRVGAQVKLSLIVIKEFEEEIQEDGYTIKQVPILKELGLNPTTGAYFERTWKLNDKEEWIPDKQVYPLDRNGKKWEEIPFTFVGAENNDPSLDQPPMLDIVRVNVGHYRNSADFEDSVFYSGQAQPWMSGLNSQYIELMKKNNIYVGSRNLIGVPEGEQFGFAIAPPNPLVRQAMIDKLELAIGLGARFIQPGGAAKTATEAEGEQRVQHSVLSLISANLADAYKRCFDWCGMYLKNVDTEKAVYEPTRDFISPNATAQDIQAIVAGWMGGAIPQADMLRWFQQRGIVDAEKTVEELMEELGTMPTMPNMEA